MAQLVALLKLTKPGVLIGNVLTVPAGFFLASRPPFDWFVFLAVMLGSTAIIAAACVLNNYLDQDIDQLMDRTKQRPLVAGQVSNKLALIWCAFLLITGFAILWLGTNPLVVVAGGLGFVTYVWLYGAWTKRRSVHGTLVGSISGAIPILSGYLAASYTFDLGALLVFLIVFLWQQPEFYAISIYRHKEYKAAGLPVMAVVKGASHAQSQILAYIVAFASANVLLAVFGYSGWLYAAIMGVFCLVWFGYGWHNKSRLDAEQWGRKMFKYSMYAIVLVSLLMPFAAFMP